MHRFLQLVLVLVSVASAGSCAFAQSEDTGIEFRVLTGLKIGGVHRGPSGEVLEEFESSVSFILYFKNVSDHEITVPTARFEPDVEVREGKAYVTFSIPDRRSPAKDPIAYSVADLALVRLLPGEVAVHASAMNARYLSHTGVSDFVCEVVLDSTKACRYRFATGRFSQPIQPFGPIMKKGEPGATDNPDNAQRLREDH